MMLDIIEIQFREEFTSTLAELLTTEYMQSNKCFQALNLEKSTFFKEFEAVLKQRSLLFILLADVKKLKEGELSFVSFGSGGDLLDYFPQGEISFENNPDFDKVPTIYHMRKYMMYKCLQPLWRDYSPKRGQFFYGTNLFVNPLHQGQGNAYKLLYLSYLKILSLGYRYFVGNVVNEYVKFVVRRAHLIIPEIVISLDEMEVQDTKTKPLQGAGLTQCLYVIDLVKSIENYHEILIRDSKMKVKPKL